MRIEQEIRGTTVQNDAWLFPPGVVTMDTDLNQLRAHDGVTMGGHVIPNAASIIGFGTTEFNSVVTTSVPGAIPGTDVGKLIRITAAGTYSLPSVVGKPVGSRILVQALVAGVTLEPAAGQTINQSGADLTTTTISNKEIVTLNTFDADSWIVVNRY